MSNDAARVVDEVRRAGLVGHRDDIDGGVLRVTHLDDGYLGRIVIRRGRVTHAELGSRTFPFWPNHDKPHEHELLELLQQIRTLA